MQSKTAPTSAQLGAEIGGSQLQGNPLRALSLQNDMHNRYSTAADRYRTEATNVTNQSGKPNHSIVSANELASSHQYPKFGKHEHVSSSLTKQGKTDSISS